MGRAARKGAAMSERKRLENRRLAIAAEFWHRDQRYRCHIGRFTDGGSIAELFLDSARPNSALDAFAADAAILISLLLQHGATPSESIGNRDRYPIAAALLSLTRIETDGAAISELVGVAHEISTGPGAANSRHSASASTQRCASGRQPVEQRLGFLQIACFKPFGEPAVDGSEQVTGLLSLAPIAP